MAPTLKKKTTTCPYGPDDRLRAWQSFGHAAGTVREGDVLRGDDPLVLEHWPWFQPVDTPTAERKNVWTEMPEAAPPADPSAVTVTETNQIPVWRQVRSLVDLAQPLSWSPGSPGSETGRPPAFAVSQLRRGQSLDVLHPLVREHPSWFTTIARELTEDDIRRAERLEGGE